MEIANPIKNDSASQTVDSSTDRDEDTWEYAHVRERGLYCQDVDVHYMSSWKSLKEKILSLNINKETPRTHISEIRRESSRAQERAMLMLISQFIEHHYDDEDPLVQNAFNRLLNNHLLRLSLSKRKQVSDFKTDTEDTTFPSIDLIKELEYIKDITEWLKNLPLDSSFYTLGNRERTDFVNSLAMSIRETEEERENNNAMINEQKLVILILEHVKLLPLPKKYMPNIPFIVEQLYRRIISHRANVEESIRTNESLNSTGLNSDNIGDFLEEFIRINGAEIADDEVKMEAWSIRLIREVKEIMHHFSEPVLSKAKAYEKLIHVPIPGDETVIYFNIELNYVKEITKWMKNLPLLPMNQTQKDDVITKICNLSEIMAESDRIIKNSPNKKETIESDLKKCIETWILELPLDRKQQIPIALATNQLMKRKEKAKQELPDTNKLHSDNTTTQKRTKSFSSRFKCKKNKHMNSDELREKCLSRIFKDKHPNADKSIKNKSMRIPEHTNRDDLEYHMNSSHKRNLFKNNRLSRDSRCDTKMCGKFNLGQDYFSADADEYDDNDTSSEYSTCLCESVKARSVKKHSKILKNNFCERYDLPYDCSIHLPGFYYFY